jgi:hypothetical protein
LVAKAPALPPSGQNHRLVPLAPTLHPERIDAFWSSVENRGHEDECWPWVGPLDGNGYGVTSVRGKKAQAHQVAFVLSSGVLINKQVVRHSCDNPPCCNPEHLLAGSKADNSMDMVTRGRSLVGTKQPNAKLTEENVMAIRLDHRSQSVLAKEYGVARRTIRSIKTRKTWRHI